MARKTIQPFENNNKRSQGRLGEGGPLKTNLIRIIVSLYNQLLRLMLTSRHINFILIQPGAPDSTDFSTVIDRGVFLLRQDVASVRTQESGCGGCRTLLREQAVIMAIDRNVFWNTVSHRVVQEQNIDAIKVVKD